MRVTQDIEQLRRIKVAELTRDALDQFEERLLQEQAQLEDIPGEALFVRTKQLAKSGGVHTDADSDTASVHRKQCSCQPPRVRLPHVEDHNLARRPPSPLGFYDYGCITLRSKSLVGQHSSRNVSTMKRAVSTSGFYFPGTQLKQGAYGFSLLEPILLSPRPWQQVTETSLRWKGDQADLRPLASEEYHKMKKQRSDSPTISPSVRPSCGHEQRVRRAFHCMDNQREDAILEQLRFERGVFAGQWTDPAQDCKAFSGRPVEEYAWLEIEMDDMTPGQQAASKLLFKLEEIVNRKRCKLQNLFASENKGTLGVLEVDEFVAGLVKVGCVQASEMTADRLISIMSTIDPAFEGRVKLPALNRAVNAARGVRMRKEEKQEQLRKQRQVKLQACYSESLPVDIVKVDHPASSLLDFNRSFQKFMNQQEMLLEQHSEREGVPAQVECSNRG